MNLGNISKAILTTLLNKKIFNRHTPEKKLINSKIRWASNEEKKQFKKEYKWLINEGIISQEKKRTGKGSEWHIRLNIRKLDEVIELLE